MLFAAAIILLTSYIILQTCLLKQVVIEFYDSVTKGQALDRWSTSVTTRQSSCEHDSALAAPSVRLYGIGDFTHGTRYLFGFVEIFMMTVGNHLCILFMFLMVYNMKVECFCYSVYLYFIVKYISDMMLGHITLKHCGEHAEGLCDW